MNTIRAAVHVCKSVTVPIMSPGDMRDTEYIQRPCSQTTRDARCIKVTGLIAC